MKDADRDEETALKEEMVLQRVVQAGRALRTVVAAAAPGRGSNCADDACVAATPNAPPDTAAVGVLTPLTPLTAAVVPLATAVSPNAAPFSRMRTGALRVRSACRRRPFWRLRSWAPGLRPVRRTPPTRPPANRLATSS